MVFQGRRCVVNENHSRKNVIVPGLEGIRPCDSVTIFHRFGPQKPNLSHWRWFYFDTHRPARPPVPSSRTTLLTITCKISTAMRHPPHRPSKPPTPKNHPQRRKLAHATRLIWGHVKCVYLSGQ